MSASTKPWPFPGDSELARARRVAREYRQQLHTVNPSVCLAVDRKMAEYGETWVLPRLVVHDLDDWLTVAQACDLAAVKPATLRQWRARGRLTGRTVDGRWEYLAREVLAVVSSVRYRRPNV